MIKSMTGYGRGESELEGKKIITEIRSYNHRFCDISLKIPRRFLPLENDIKKLVSSSIPRGKIDVNIQLESADENSYNLAVNVPLARKLYDLITTLKKELRITEKVSLSTLLSFKDIIIARPEESDTSKDWHNLRPSLEQALQSVQKMQEMEGKEIHSDLLKRLNTIKSLVGEIKTIFPVSLSNRQKAMRTRVKNLCEDITLDESRILQEIALIADKSDITEEVVRAESHLEQFFHWLAIAEPVGRKFDFLIQEINREVNTIGSKASDAEISMKVVLIKNELEKIREQVQNIV